MRPQFVVGGLVGLFALTLPARAQSPSVTPLSPTAPPSNSAPPEVATVRVPEVEVRSGGSDKFYATSKLRMGEQVQVVRESAEFPGYLAIKPPRDSFSWINAKFVTDTKVQN